MYWRAKEKEYYAIGNVVDYRGKLIATVQIPIRIEQIPLLPDTIKCGVDVAVLIKTHPITYKDYGEPMPIIGYI